MVGLAASIRGKSELSLILKFSENVAISISVSFDGSHIHKFR